VKKTYKINAIDTNNKYTRCMLKSFFNKIQHVIVNAVYKLKGKIEPRIFSHIKLYKLQSTIKSQFL